MLGWRIHSRRTETSRPVESFLDFIFASELLPGSTESRPTGLEQRHGKRATRNGGGGTPIVNGGDVIDLGYTLPDVGTLVGSNSTYNGGTLVMTISPGVHGPEITGGDFASHFTTQAVYTINVVPEPAT